MAIGKTIAAFILIGFSILAIGFYYIILDESIVYIVRTDYWINGTTFIELMRTGWNVIPIVILIMSFLSIGVIAFRNRRVQERIEL